MEKMIQKKSGTNKKCPVCEEKFYIPKYKFDKIYCSRECFLEDNNKSKHIDYSECGGKRKNSGIGKGCWYESEIAGRVHLDSSYELAYAKYLDEEEKDWKRNKEKFTYKYQNEEREYIPDFYLIREDKFVEIKGFKTNKDEAKWKDFPNKLVVLYKDDLKELGCEV